MTRSNTQPGAKFTVRGQRYTQTESFFHTMRSGDEVRILELDSQCPECGGMFRTTATMRQIRSRALVRRCERCRLLYRGRVEMPPAKATAKAKSKRRTLRRAGTVRRRDGGTPPAAEAPSSPKERREALETVIDTYRAALGLLD